MADVEQHNTLSVVSEREEAESEDQQARDETVTEDDTEELPQTAHNDATHERSEADDIVNEESLYQEGPLEVPSRPLQYNADAEDLQEQHLEAFEDDDEEPPAQSQLQTQPQPQDSADVDDLQEDGDAQPQQFSDDDDMQDDYSDYDDDSTAAYDDDNDDGLLEAAMGGGGRLTVDEEQRVKATTFRPSAQQERMRRANIENHLRRCAAELSQLELEMLAHEAAEHEAQAQVERLQARAAVLDTEMDGLMAGTNVADEKLKLRVRTLQQEQDVTLEQAEEAQDQHRHARAQLAAARAKMNDARLSMSKMSQLKLELDAKTAENRRAEKIVGEVRQRQERTLGAQRAKETVGRQMAVASVLAELDEGRKREAAVAAAGQRKAVAAAQAALALEKQRAAKLAAEQEAEAQRKLRSLEALKGAVDHVAENDRRRALARRKRQAQQKARREQEAAKLLAKGENPDLVFLLREKEAERRKRAALEAQRRQQKAGEIAERLYDEAAVRREEMTQRRDHLRNAVLDSAIAGMQATTRAQTGPRAPTLHTAPQTAPTTFSGTKRAEAYERRHRRDDDRSAPRPAATSAADGSSVVQDDTLGTDRDARGGAASQPFATAPKPVPPPAPADGIPDVEAQARAAANLDFGDSDEENEEDVASKGLLIKDPFNPDGVAAAALDAPEMQGLWNLADATQNTSGTSSWVKEPTADAWGEDTGSRAPISRPGKKLSVLEQRRLEEALVRQKENIVQKQVVAGREFSGPGFVSKPAQVIFTDYDMGKVYRQRITLTNVSYSVNSFQLLPTPSEEISYEYTPSGGLSPGLSIDLVVVFEPKLMRDLDTKIELLAQTGAFEIPLKCTRKRCEPHLSAQHLDFGQIFMGESASKNLMISNKGALASKYRITLEERKQQVEELDQGPPQVDFLAPSRGISITAADGGDGKGASPGSHDGDIANVADAAGMLLQDKARAEALVTMENTVPFAGEPPLPREAHGKVDSQGRGPDAAGSEDAQSNQTGTPPWPGNAKRGSLAAPLPPAQPLDITLDTPMTGFLAPRADVELHFHFAADAVGTTHDTYRLHFEDSDAEDILFTVTAQSCHVPVYFSETSFDLRTCMVDHAYVSHVFVHNARATGASKVSLTVPPQARGLIELKPRAGLVPAKGKLKIEISLTPKADSVEQLAPGMADRDSGRVAVPLTLQAEGQTREGTLLFCAHITPAHVQVSVELLDFGRVSTHESVVRRVRLTNHSALPQTFGFTGLPNWLTVQPDEGFGTLLPFESLACDVVFSPPRHPHDDDEQKFLTTIAVEYRGRETVHHIRCTGIGVSPALALSTNHVTFRPTCIGDASTTTITLRNTSDVARIYQVALPKDAPLEISPICAEILPHGRQLLWLRFSPTLAEWERRPPTPKEAPKTSIKKVKQKQPIKSPAQRAEEERTAREAEEQRVAGLRAALPLVQRIDVPFYVRAHKQLHLASDDVNEDEGERGAGSQASRYDIARDETVHLALALPMCAPLVALDPAETAATHDFGQVALGVRAQHTFCLRNLSETEPVTLEVSPPDPCSSFSLTRALRPIPPGETMAVALTFAPGEVSAYFDILELQCVCANVQQCFRLKLYGEGVRSSLEVKLPQAAKHAQRLAGCTGVPLPPTHSLLFPDCAVGGARAETLVLRNTSPFPLPFCVSVLSGSGRHRSRSALVSVGDAERSTDSGSGRGSDARQKKAAAAAAVVMYDPLRADAMVRRPSLDASAADVDNLGPLSAFSVSVVQGTLVSEASREVVVTFRPDRPSLDYRATLIVFYGENRAHQERIDLRGRAWLPGPFVCGFDRIDVPDADNMLSVGNLFAVTGGADGADGSDAAGGGSDGPGVGGAGAGGGASGGADGDGGEGAGGGMNAKQAAAAAAAAAAGSEAMANRVTLVYSLSGQHPAELSTRDIAVGVASIETKKKTTAEVVFEPLSAQARALGFVQTGALRSSADQDTPVLVHFGFSPAVPEVSAAVSITSDASKQKAVVALAEGGKDEGSARQAEREPRAKDKAEDGEGAPRVAAGSVVYERLALTVRVGGSARVFPFEVILRVVE